MNLDNFNPIDKVLPHNILNELFIRNYGPWGMNSLFNIVVGYVQNALNYGKLFAVFLLQLPSASCMFRNLPLRGKINSFSHSPILTYPPSIFQYRNGELFLCPMIKFYSLQAMPWKVAAIFWIACFAVMFTMVLSAVFDFASVDFSLLFLRSLRTLPPKMTGVSIFTLTAKMGGVFLLTLADSTHFQYFNYKNQPIVFDKSFFFKYFLIIFALKTNL